MHKPRVAIIGRPNVGKSTLFNKLTQSRTAITEDTPGVTRDRIYRDAEWLGKVFTLVDTGGLEPKSEDIFLKHIKAQVELAIETCQVILFVVDGRGGVTAIDRDIATMLRRTEKPVLLVINKMDHPGLKDALYDFYELGFEKIYPISAENSLRLGDLLDGILDYLSFNDDEEPDDVVKISVIGKPNVGKSSFVNALLGEERMIVTDIAGTTRDAIDSRVQYNGAEYIFIDTAGLRKRKNVEPGVERYSVVRTLDAVDRSDIALLMIDASEGVTEQDTKIAGYAFERKKAIVIVINKWDLIEKDTHTMKRFEEQVRTKLSYLAHCPIVFISVKERQRFNRVFEWIDKVNQFYDLRIKTGVLNDILSDAVLRNPPPTDKGERLKLYYMTQVDTRPPVFMISINKKELLHFSYQRYLENRLREHFGFDGCPIVFKWRTKGEKE